jgi:hypothetical protein
VIQFVAEDGARYAENATSLRERFRAEGWREFRFAITPNGAGGSYERDDVFVAFALRSSSTLEACATAFEPMLCESAIYIGVPPGKRRLLGIEF